MLPLPTRSVFRSRWKALYWAGGVCVAAVSFAGFGGKSGSDQANVSADDNSADLGEAIKALQ